MGYCSRLALLRTFLIYGVFMRKFLTAILALCACACTVTAIACNDDTQSSNDLSGSSISASDLGNSSDESSQIHNNRVVSFEEGEGFSFVNANVADGGTIPEGSMLTFSLSLGAFYTGSPIVYVNDTPTAPKQDGTYEIVVGAEDGATCIKSAK